MCLRSGEAEPTGLLFWLLQRCEVAHYVSEERLAQGMIELWHPEHDYQTYDLRDGRPKPERSNPGRRAGKHDSSLSNRKIIIVTNLPKVQPRGVRLLFAVEMLSSLGPSMRELVRYDMELRVIA